MSAEAGQAQIETVVVAFVLVAVAAFAVTVATTVNSILVADAATHAGALSQSAGGDGVAAARRALPRSLRSQARIRARRGLVSVRIPAGGPALRDRSATVGSRAFSRLPGQ